LKELNLKKNKLTSCEGIERLYNLHTLILEENEIATLKGLAVLPKLITLNLKTNKLEKLDNLPRLELLEDIQLDANLMATNELPKLNETKTLKSLSMGGNPFADEKGDDFKKEVLVACMADLPKLKQINGDGWEDELVQEAIALKEERRLAAEEAAKNPPPAEGEEPKEEEA